MDANAPRPTAGRWAFVGAIEPANKFIRLRDLVRVAGVDMLCGHDWEKFALRCFTN
jgi:hypothetical protein